MVVVFVVDVFPQKKEALLLQDLQVENHHCADNDGKMNPIGEAQQHADIDQIESHKGIFADGWA